MNKFCERLKEAMELKNISQTELCLRTGIPKSAMSQYVSGAFIPKQDRTYLIAQALDISESWLMGYDVPMEKLKIEPDVIEAIKNLNTNIKLSEIPLVKISEKPLTVKNLKKIDFANKIDNFDYKKFAENYKKFMETFRPEILEYYNQLNDEGKKEATKRVKELTYLPDYKK